MAGVRGLFALLTSVPDGFCAAAVAARTVRATGKIVLRMLPPRFQTVFLSYEAKLLRQFFDCGQHPLEKGGCRTVGAEHKLKLAVGIGGDPVGVFTGGSRGAEVEVDGTICIFQFLQHENVSCDPGSSCAPHCRGFGLRHLDG
jgi:hypothetical protein